jgi:hypothetical protein
MSVDIDAPTLYGFPPRVRGSHNITLVALANESLTQTVD